MAGMNERDEMWERWAVGLLAVLAFAVCCLRSFVYPHIPALLWGDQLGFATKGTRILAGELPYRDYFEFVAPGTALVYAGLYWCLGVSLWVPNVVMALLAAGASVQMTVVSRRVMRGGWALLPGVLLVGFVLYGSMDATHHWFSTVAVMGAALVLGRGSSLRRVAAAGALCGVAAVFTQTKGAAMVVGVAVYLAWKARRDGGAWLRRCLILAGAALCVVAVVDGPLIYLAGWHNWVQQTIVYPLRYFPTNRSNSVVGFWYEFWERGTALKWLCFPLMYATVPLAYVGFFRLLHQRRGREADELWDQLVLLAVAGVAMLAAVAGALSIRRISTASLPAMVLLAWMMSREGKRWVRMGWVLGAVSLGVALVQVARIQMHERAIVELPVGRALIVEAGQVELYQWMAAHTRPGEWYFGLPPLILPLGLRNPTPMEAPMPGEYSRPEQVRVTIESLEATRTPLIVLLPIMYQPHAGEVDHLGPFRTYLRQHYRMETRLAAGDEVWVRAESTLP